MATGCLYLATKYVCGVPLSPIEEWNEYMNAHMQCCGNKSRMTLKKSSYFHYKPIVLATYSKFVNKFLARSCFIKRHAVYKTPD